MERNPDASAASLDKMKLPELRALAAERGIKGTSRLRKAELVTAISGGTPTSTPKSADSHTPSHPAGERAEPKAEPRQSVPRRAQRGAGSTGRSEEPSTEAAPVVDVKAAVAQDLATTAAERREVRSDRPTEEPRETARGQRRERGAGSKHREAQSRGENPNRDDRQSADDRATVALEEIALPEGGEPGRPRNRRDRGSRRRGRGGNRDNGNAPREQSSNQRGGGPRQKEADNEPVDESTLIPIAGIVDIQSNHAFVRTSGYLPGSNDVYVTLGNVRRWGLRRGDAVVGAVRPAREGGDRGGRGQQKHNPLVRVDSVNGMSIEEAMKRREFSKLTPEYPREQLRMETTPKALTSRMIDLVAPVGKGQRGLIVSPPKAGKTMIIQQIAKAIEINNPNVHLMVVLVDERPEEVTDMRSIVKGEVIASTFDRPAGDHTTVAELAIERAKRLVELGQDVVVLLDSITRLSRAYNLAAPASGRILSGGVDAGALYPPKKFFGAARNLREGGSLTIIASALVETGSKMDEVIFEEFKGTGNMELRLSRLLADRRIFPAIDINASGTRREELLLKPEELAIMWKLRRVLGNLDQAQALESVLGKLKETQSNAEFLMLVSRTTSGD